MKVAFLLSTTWRVWVPDSVGFALLTMAENLPFPGRDIEHSRVLDVNDCSGSDDAKVREVGFFVVKHLEWRLHLERLVQRPVLEVRSRHEQLPQYARWEAAACEHASNHRAQSTSHAFGHTDLLRCAGCGELLDNTGLQAGLPELFFGVLAGLVGAPINDAATEWGGHRADEQLKRLKSLVLVGQQVDGVLAS